MKRSTLTLLATAAGICYASILITQSFLSPEFTPPPWILAAQLLVLVLIILSDLTARATMPTEPTVKNPPSRTMSREVQSLTRQIQVGADSSQGYFDRVLVARLRETLVEKVSLETGLDKGRVRELLANPALGPGTLRNEALHGLLYSPLPAKGSARFRMLEDAAALVEAWKP